VIDSNPQLQDIELITTAGVNKGAGITIDDKTLHFNKQ
jgi:hypothetical protein